MYRSSYNQYPYSDDRLFLGGGFAGPFILGGLTGALVAPYFNRPYYPYPYYQYPPYYRYY